jgi:ATP-independent RNA helicase DbpA
MNRQQEIIEHTLHHLGFRALNELQKETLLSVAQNKNTLILSQTGSGKTVAFLLPLVERLDQDANGIQAVILAPSRELAMQIESVFKAMKTNFKVLTCYGGHSMRVEINSLSESPAVLIGTPGRICDHITRGNLDLSTVAHLIVDEYDKCLEFGFEDQMKFIHQDLTNLHYTTLVSATELEVFPSYLSFDHPAVINHLSQAEEPEITFWKFPITTRDKYDQVFELLCAFKGELTIVFCNFREATESLAEFLAENGYETQVYHGGMEQEERERALIKFRNGTCHTLVCTDLGSRGLDIPEIQHVVHFQYPNSKEAFIHRNGRTARMKANGSSYLLVNPAEELPPYITVTEETFHLPKEDTIPVLSPWITLYFSGGKKDKINKIDIVGFLGQKGGVDKSEIGLITVMDFSSFVAVKRKNVRAILQRISTEKIKGKKLKIAIAK